MLLLPLLIYFQFEFFNTTTMAYNLYNSTSVMCFKQSIDNIVLTATSQIEHFSQTAT